MLTDKYPREILSHTPTPIDYLRNLTSELGGAHIWVKRDDCTGLAFGGNKTRQLEYYFGDALQKEADTILITGAVQSNYMRTAVAAARKLGMEIEVQLEERVPDRPEEYYKSGNPYLMKLMGAKFHHYPCGEDEEGADNALYERAKEIKKAGRNPYVIPLAGHHVPLGALGYVDCAVELLKQFEQKKLTVDGIVTGSGSAVTHAGLLVGLRAMGSNIPVYGFCVRRNQNDQKTRVFDKAQRVAEMIERSDVINENDIWVDDRMLGAGYGQLSKQVIDAIKQTARCEGLLIDPVYTGKSMAGLIHLVNSGYFKKNSNILFLHTGGTPAIFGYPELQE